ncbi:MAG: branched-chain amino acid ABC transporter permease [Geminicoccaceae bacterium]|nr:branched-chain amino acid ABC transporter permease [Geminicoccaceae bacterium]
MRERRRPLVWSSTAVAFFVAVAVALLAFGTVGESFYIRLVNRAMIFALAALALHLLVGVAGLVSLGQAAFLGVGAYAVGILAEHGVHDGVVHWLVGVAAAGLTALLIGAPSLRTRGVSFIMITLAFAQMLYFVANSLSRYGGNDGLTIWVPSRFPGGLSSSKPETLAWLSFVILLFAYLGLVRLRASRFGRILRGAKENERRMSALGFAVQRYRLAAFVLSGALTGLAGAMLANLTEFVAPAYMSWHRSGELLAMVVLGGSGHLHGAVAGAFLFVFIEETLSRFTSHWALVFGPFLVLAVLTDRGRTLRRLTRGIRDH